MLAVAALASVVALACEDAGTLFEPPVGYAESLDQAVLGIRDAYGRLDVDALDRMLAEDFTFEMNAIDADSVGIDATWDKATHLQWCQNLFTGKPGMRVDGRVQSPISAAIPFSLAIWFPVEIDGVDDEWTAADQGGFTRRFVGTWAINYEEFDFDFLDGVQTFIVERRQIFASGRPFDVYQVTHWYSARPDAPLPTESQWAPPKHETISFGRLAAKFRFQELPGRR